MADAATGAADIVLASASPRRAELLRQIGLGFEVYPADIDETPLPGEPPDAYVERMARAKAAAVAEPGRVTLAADTTVVQDGQILGKPRDRAEGLAMLRRLADGWHEVMTAIAVSDGRELLAETVTTRVHFRPLSDGEMTRYWETGEGADKAGGYGIQGIGGILADKIEGSYSAVVGLPLAETERLLERFGVDTWRRR